MEACSIDELVRKAIGEYRKQERERCEIAEALSVAVTVQNLQHRVEVLEREITQRYTDLLNRMERYHHER